ncbi:MAG: ABC-ATPase domain-containing protein [Gemmatimonadetes bacterium]|nr:ABC-ATPase domain-containing protein [Gemmatimonadota bacterium]MXX70900.1 ABC-ATPase domain-containing protein [Gemmatimonadota bacterium]MYC91172.1 ABC-ATPase domain-containing protein [Gemmatimonadota bacterium]MYG35050.1 ABC-ATPase domain-containing protein [Gemmatimonadota bacterium]MYJ16554.1 ABC-ATPase domain-containing protein [Gemmatimonadota bacterium]
MGGTAADLQRTLRRIDGRGYPAYRELRGTWSLPQFNLEVRRVQGDPFAAPSQVAAVLSPEAVGLEAALLATAPRRTGIACLFARAFARRSRGSRGRRTGSGRSGEIGMVDPGQVVLANTAVMVARDGAVEARFTVGLPAAGRRILGRQAETLLLGTLPKLVRETLLSDAHSPAEIARHAEVNEDADHLRAQLGKLGLVAFIANGAILPRQSGVDDRPLAGGQAIPFQSPAGLQVTMDRLNGPPLSGMGIPRGVTLLVGGGYHGKSTVLNAVAAGVYNHRPGDGREWVVTEPTATRVQAEDGRSVVGVDISPFIDRLPDGQDTRSFTTANASGSTSQAAAIVEALEAGSRLLLIDEDTAATNFMIRDRRMQALVKAEDEPITPFIDRVSSLYRDAGASTLLVIGGSGDYLDVADRVLGMIRYQPHELTDEARAVAVASPTGRTTETGAVAWPWRHRCPDPRSIRPRRGRKPIHVKVPTRTVVEIGSDRIDLGGVRQLVSRAQTRAVAQALVYAQRFMGAEMAVEDILEALRGSLDDDGLDVLDTGRTGDLALPRMQEVAAALARLRSLTMIGRKA